MGAGGGGGMVRSKLGETFLNENLFLGRGLRCGWVGSGSSREDGREGRRDGWTEGRRVGREREWQSRSDVTCGGGRPSGEAGGVLCSTEIIFRS